MKRLLMAALWLGACAPGVVRDSNGTQGDPVVAPPGGTPGSSGNSPGGSGNPPGGSGDTPPTTTPPAPPAIATGCGQLVAVSSASLADLPAGPGVRLRVRAELGGQAAPSAPWTWTVTYGDGLGELVDVIPIDAQRSVVEVPLERAGRYQLEADVKECRLAEAAFATATATRLSQFRVRLAAPAGQPYPVQESVLQVKAGQRPAPAPLVLLAGTEVAFEPHDAAGTGSVASYIRITEPLSLLTVEGHTALSPFRARLLPSMVYDVLFVPDGDVAPVLQLARTPSALAVLPLQLTPGTPVTGTLADGAGRPVADARVILRAGVLTSTVGASDAGGAFALRARTGTFTLSVAPSPQSGLPDLTATGVVVPGETESVAFQIAWASLPTAAPALSVQGPDGLRPAVGARVTIDRATALPAAGTLRINGMAISLDGLAHATGVVAASGAVALPPVPSGSYRVTVVPADGDAASALTTATLDLGPGSQVQTIKLAAPVQLHGTLAAAPAGTRVFAGARAGDPPRPAVSAGVNADGSYALGVDPGRDYVVWAEPSRGGARAQLALVRAGATEVPARTLPPTLDVPATVTGSGSSGGLAGVVVQVFCEARSPSCLDPTLPLVEAVTTSGGAVSLRLPDPAAP
jgi:hypothetical protein